MNDEQILALYFARDDRAVMETDRKYGRFCFSLAQEILHNQQDSEETVSDTYLRVWNVIPPQKPVVFKMFLAKITRNLAFTRWRRFSAEKRGGGQMDLVLEELAECISAPGAVDDNWNRKELEQAIRNFLKTLPSREQDVFVRRYFFVESTDAIAKRYAMKPNTVLRTLSRNRKKLKEYLIREGFAL